MDPRKFVLKETALVALGQAVCVGIMLGIFALLDRFDRTVLLGGIFGGVLATANFFFMAVGASLAADKAEAQDVAGGKNTVKLSYILRTVVQFVIMFALIKGGLCDVLSLVIPLIFTRPILYVGEFFRKPGEQKS